MTDFSKFIKPVLNAPVSSPDQHPDGFLVSFLQDKSDTKLINQFITKIIIGLR